MHLDQFIHLILPVAKMPFTPFRKFHQVAKQQQETELSGDEKGIPSGVYLTEMPRFVCI